MKLTYYGTAAAEGIPALYCSCDTCKYSKKVGGKNIRTRSQALVDNDLLIDLPPDTLYHFQYLGLPLNNIEHVLITHKHADHLHTPTINVRSRGYVTHEIPPINIYGSMPTIDLIFDDLRKGGVLERGTWNLFELAPFKKTNIGKYDVVPYKANHDFHTYPYIYEIGFENKKILYGHDTGIFLDETWAYLETNKPYFNLVSLDCTMGIASSSGHHHMNVNDCVTIKDKLTELSCADDKTIFILNHFSHNGHVSYDELSKIAKSNGFLVSYDGMEVEF